MIARRVKLRPSKAQQALLETWFQIGTGVWNWGISSLLAEERAFRQYGRETPPPAWATGARSPDWVSTLPGGRRLDRYALYARLNGHSRMLEVPTDVLRGVVDDLWRGWGDYRKGTKGRPRRKGLRNKLSSLCLKSGTRYQDRTHLMLPLLGPVRIHAQADLAPLCVRPDGSSAVKQARLQRLPRGWYLTLQLDAAPRAIPLVDDRVAGVDLGFQTLATLSTGEQIANPREYHRLEQRLAQVQRSGSRRRSGRIQQRIANARRVRNHQISRDLVARHRALYISRDNLRGFQRGGFGKSVLSAGIGQLLGMLQAKSRQAGRVYLEVSNVNSTRTCSTCEALSGPRGKAGLRVRAWDCGACGAHHDRDVNAAVNTLRLGAASVLRAAG